MKQAFQPNGKTLAGYIEVTSLAAAAQIARENGAVEFGISYYPGNYSLPHGRVSMYFYFDAAGEEVSHYSPELGIVDLRIKGRSWHPDIKKQLDMRKLPQEHAHWRIVRNGTVILTAATLPEAFALAEAKGAEVYDPTLYELPAEG